MKELTKDILISLFMGLVLPGMILNFAVTLWDRTDREEMQEVPGVLAAEKERVSLPVLVRTAQDTVHRQDMDAYLVEVVLAEMPASFEEEALKAQAVVARTYARKAYITKGKHGDGSICTDPSCCQGCCSRTAYLQKGGTEEEIQKISDAVYSTSGQVLTFEGDLIEATYFSCSGGSTEDAAAVWGSDFPYLQAVDSPGEEAAAHFRDTVSFTREELEQKLGVLLTGQPDAWVGKITYTEGGGVDTAVIAGLYFTGTELRQKLGLHSTAFSVTAQEAGLSITTKGYGHRVGMSQYGADAMAVAGSSYAEILAHYYPGTELIRLQGEV